MYLPFQKEILGINGGNVQLVDGGAQGLQLGVEVSALGLEVGVNLGGQGCKLGQVQAGCGCGAVALGVHINSSLL